MYWYSATLGCLKTLDFLKVQLTQKVRTQGHTYLREFILKNAMKIFCMIVITMDNIMAQFSV